MMRKSTCIILSLVLICGIFSGCGASGAEEFASESEPESIPEFEPRVWVDYDGNDELTQEKLTLPEFPGVTFVWTPEGVTANGEELFSGWFARSIFLADLTNDGKPEFCTIGSFGSGMITTYVIVYDYAEDKAYSLTYYNYINCNFEIGDDGHLKGKLLITRSDYKTGKERRETKELILADGELIGF